MSAMEQARSIVATMTGNGLETIDEEATIQSVSRWDSIAHVSIVLEIEKITGRSIGPAEIVKLGSIAGIADILGES